MTNASSLNERMQMVALEPSGHVDDLAESVREGLTHPNKYLPCRFFYDEAGSLLFERICDLPEYYLTRTEREILVDCADDLARSFEHPTSLVELGSGSSAKTRVLIEAFLSNHGRLRYVPLDISPTILEESAHTLLQDYPGLKIFGIAAEYHAGLRRIAGVTQDAKLVVFLGSTIGNFTPSEAMVFLRRVRETMGEKDRLLVGADLRKDPAILEAAYDDAAGVTAAFNKNLLVRINRELAADFDLDAFDHQAKFNQAAGRMEMYLVSNREQSVTIGELDLVVEFAAGERIHTENSHKYTLEQLAELASDAGLRTQQRWQDAEGRMTVELLAPSSTS